ncbi:MAG: tolC [Chthoniobacteraceae bacterium]|nr:tolC [Chthoniobacteraceae bacterium]
MKSFLRTLSGFPAVCTLAAAALLCSSASGVVPVKKALPAVKTLTLDEAVQIALRQNPDIRRAKQEIERTRGVVIEVRAQALPLVAATSSYTQQDRNLLESGGQSSSISSVTGESSGTAQSSNAASSSGGSSAGSHDKSWRVAIEAKQVLYAGGQVRAALNIAKLTQESSFYTLRDTVDRVITQVRQQFYAVLLNRSLIVVQEESIKLLESQLADQRSRFDAGTVPRFNVLRAEVELANVVPELIRARNNLLIAQLQLAKTLALEPAGSPDVAPVNARGELLGNGAPLPLGQALAHAKAQRASLKVQRQNLLLEAEQIKVALAGYKPRVTANAGYELQNSRLSQDLDDTVNGWFFGFQGTWNIFDGLETHGKVIQARARLESARVNYLDSVQQVELEVQQAFAKVNEARQLIASQGKTIEQAQEALRLARERLDAGAGTQLEVLDARTALTRSQVTELQARYDYNFAKAEYDRAAASDTQYQETFDDPLTRKGKPNAFKSVR